jgi:hypothetical protein
VAHQIQRPNRQQVIEQVVLEPEHWLVAAFARVDRRAGHRRRHAVPVRRVERRP